MELARIKLDIDGPVAALTLNHPEVMNAISHEMLGGLSEALDYVAARDEWSALSANDRSGTRLFRWR